jgi:hypothetical protein
MPHPTESPTAAAEPRSEAAPQARSVTMTEAELAGLRASSTTFPFQLFELIRFLRVRFSGRYVFNGGAASRDARVLEDVARDLATLNDPIHALDQPIFVRPFDPSILTRLRFTLHIDIDGPDALDVVSGDVAMGLLAPGASPAHFIGRVTGNTPITGGKELVVEDFSFVWPRSTSTIDRLEIRVTGSWFMSPVAEVTFVDTVTSRRFGPYRVTQTSMYFREVEVDVDVETGAIDPEPYDTHDHPDRPSDLPREQLTLESAFERAGVRMTRSPGSGDTVDTSGAGANSRWSYQELHDSMELHWQAFANVAQWKMWIFLARLADSDSLGGVMFDGDIDEPGGVDRQGTAVFTHSPFFHDASGDYPQANPPANAAARRELFFDLIHETGHAFNLAHSFQKLSSWGPDDVAWPAPSWMPVVQDARALSWMNYPDSASPGGGYNATWFYERFRFRFDDNELLFLRHAPGSFVQMGNAAWFHNHGRVARDTLNPAIALVLRSRKEVLELGEPVFLELKLKNVSDAVLPVHANLDPSDGMVELAVTHPDGRRVPFVPLAHTRNMLLPRTLEPGESMYQAINATVGRFGFDFKEPGAYRVEASYRNVDGSTAAAAMRVYVRPAHAYDDLPVLHDLFEARTGRALYLGGTRVMEDVNERLERASARLGPKHPATFALETTRYAPLIEDRKVVAPDSDRLHIQERDPEPVAEHLQKLVAEPEAAADALGHITYRQAVDTYTDAAEAVGEKGDAVKAQKTMKALFQKRGVIEPVVKAIESRVRTLA